MSAETTDNAGDRSRRARERLAEIDLAILDAEAVCRDTVAKMKSIYETSVAEAQASHDERMGKLRALRSEYAKFAAPAEQGTSHDQVQETAKRSPHGNHWRRFLRWPMSRR
jgi:hypothetical protein